jgi:1-acyl-sn-glycerol-3-phosphate acyltransferase
MKNEQLIDVKKLITSKNPGLAKWLPGFLIRYLKRILHEEEINRFIEDNKNFYNHAFCERILEQFQIDVSIKGLENLPQEGGVIVAMNHPLGGMDAIAFLHAIRSRRSDVRFIVNDLLLHLENLKDLFVGVNKHGRSALSSRKIIDQAFQENDVIGIFPAGLVSRKKRGIVRDLEWKKTFVHYGLKYQQPIVPVHIEGALSSFFYRLSNFREKTGIRANLEMLYLADELYRQKGSTITFTVGEAIDVATFHPELSERERAQKIKELVYSLPNKKSNGTYY